MDNSEALQCAMAQYFIVTDATKYHNDLLECFIAKHVKVFVFVTL